MIQVYVKSKEITRSRGLTRPSNPMIHPLTSSISKWRAAQSVWHYTRASIPTIGSDDLGVLKESRRIVHRSCASKFSCNFSCNFSTNQKKTTMCVALLSSFNSYQHGHNPCFLSKSVKLNEIISHHSFYDNAACGSYPGVPDAQRQGALSFNQFDPFSFPLLCLVLVSISRSFSAAQRQVELHWD